MSDRTIISSGKGWYSEMLKDARWQKRRAEVMQSAGWMCEECRATTELQAHHVYYICGRLPWEYPLALLMCVCRKCHEERQAVEHDLYLNVATILRDKCIAEIKQIPIYAFFRDNE